MGNLPHVKLLVTIVACTRFCLSVTIEVQAQETSFADFLKYPATGIIRLFPQNKFATTYTLSINESEGFCQ
jgi:hypothetical protein